MKALKISLVLVFVTGTIFAADLRVPKDYDFVSDALAVVESGDRILVSPGNYNDPDCGMIPYGIDGISIIGMGNSPSETKYLFPSSSPGWGLLIRSNCRLENIQVGTSNASFVIQVADDSTGVEIRNVVVSPMYAEGIIVSEGAEVELSNVTLCGNGTVNRDGIFLATYTSIVVKNSIFYNLDSAFYGAIAKSEISEYHNCYDRVQYPVPDGYEIDPTSIVGPSGISYPDWAPPYGSIVIDAGDPSGYDPDGTLPDIGAMRYNQTSHLIGFGETAPARLPGIGIGDTPKIFRAGDVCTLQSVITKPVGYPIPDINETVDCFLILDVYGDLWFWPSWRYGEPDSLKNDLIDGYYRSEEVFSFIWPTVGGSASGLRFWAATLKMTPEESQLGPIACLEFGYE